MKTFTINSLIKFYRDKGIRLGVNSFLALFILILFSTNARGQTIDFQQAQNGDPTAFPVTFTNGILNATQTTYYEGLGIPQRLIFTGLDPAAAKYTVFFQFLAGIPNKGVHAYDMLMSWEQAELTARKIGGAIVGSETQNELANLFSTACQNAPAECAALSGALPAANIKRPVVPDVPVATSGFYSGVDENITCFENTFGNRDIEIRGNAAITSAVLTFIGYDGDFANFKLEWISTSSNIMIRYASRAAVGDGGANNFACGYGVGHGAGSISGGNYHNIFQKLVKNNNTGNEIQGSRDNQLSAGAITPVAPPSCPSISAQSVCATATSMVYTVASPESGVTYNWTLTNGSPSAGAKLQGANASGVFTGTTVTVIPIATSFTGGTFSLNLTMVKSGVPDVNCPYTGIGTVISVSASASASPAGNVSVTSATPHYQLHATVNGIEDNSAYSYSWSQSPTTGGSLSSATIPNPTFSATVAGTYEWTVTATLIASPNCPATATVSRTIDAAAGCPTVPRSAICQQTTNTYTASVAPASGETWTWSVDNGASLVLPPASGGIANGGQSIKVLAGTQNFTLTLTKDFANPLLTDQVCTYAVTVVATPSLVTHYNPPACTDKSFSVDVISPTSGYTYSIDQPDNSRTFTPVTPGNTTNFSFTGLTLGDGFIVTVATTGPGCTASSSCTNPSPGSSRIATNQENTEADKTIKQSIAETYKIVLKSGTKVNAVPNPFREKIRFNLVSTISGMGSLELYNITGQKVAVVYQGYVEAGREVIKEYAVSSEKRGTLIYVFKVGDQRVTGKLIGIK